MSFRKKNFSGPNYKLILLGDVGVGKTNLFWRFTHNSSLPSQQSITAIDFCHKYIDLHDREVKLTIWDTAGQQKFRAIIRTYFRDCDGVMLVFDLTNPESWLNIRNIWYDFASARAQSAAYILIGNKSDLLCQICQEQINKWCIQYGVYFIKTCAIAGTNVQQAFFTFAALIDKSNDISQYSPLKKTQTISSNSTMRDIKIPRFSTTAFYYRTSNLGEGFQLKVQQEKNDKKQCCL